MAHTVTVVNSKRLSKGGGIAIVDVNTTSYGSGGDVFSAAEFDKMGFGKVDAVFPLAKVGSYEAEFNHSTNKLRFFQGGRATVTENFTDVPGAIFADLTSDQASAPEGGADVMALSDANATSSGNLAHASGKSTGITNPTIPRNVVVVQKANTAGVTFTAANVVVTGTYRGVAQTDTIALQTGAVASNNHRLTVGTKPFETITNVTLSAAQPTNAQISIGVGTKLGLRDALLTPAEADIKDLRKGTAAVASSTYVGDGTNNAIDVGANIADGDDFSVTYVAGKTEVPVGTNVGSGRFMVTYLGRR